MFVIEKNVPLPERRRPGPGYKYPFAELRPGDSFLVPGADLKNIRSCVCTFVHGRHGRAGHGGAFRCAAVEGGVRVWRLPDAPAPEAPATAAPAAPVAASLPPAQRTLPAVPAPVRLPMVRKQRVAS